MLKVQCKIISNHGILFTSCEKGNHINYLIVHQAYVECTGQDSLPYLCDLEQALDNGTSDSRPTTRIDQY